MSGLNVLIWFDHLTVVYIYESYQLCYLRHEGIYKMDEKALSTQCWENYRTYNWPALRCTIVSLTESHHEVLELFGYGVSDIYVWLESLYYVLKFCDMRWIVSNMLIIDGSGIPRRYKARMASEWTIIS